MKKKTLAMILAVTVLFGGAVGGTLAWLTDKTDSVKNTFTVGNIDIELEETTGEEYKMIPGNTLDKNPLVTVLDDSEDCWLFIKVEKTGGNVSVEENGNTVKYTFDNYLKYTMEEDWISLDETNHPGVYYREVEMSNTDQEFHVLENDQITVKDEVTKQMMDALEKAGADSYPKLTFTAYAVQKDNIANASLAWTEANK